MVPFRRPKEGYDIVRKIWKGQPVIETLQDSYKDMDNNIEALNYGLLHPNDNCRNWLKDFDYKTIDGENDHKFFN